ncbi:Monocarboxylate transporter 10 [Smittium mucronatum]|uniref:Monocarboxylate transporter 10 n=1 Tax=Smittium mucronatum TaxID=133383 RepID=A0A1R0H629_9FUNG|nr:Monocarboxylate transporter 10 [Smittium mucronatum]
MVNLSSGLDKKDLEKVINHEEGNSSETNNEGHIENGLDQNTGVKPPDEGYSWLILIAGLLNFMISFGSFNAFGVFQTYYLLTRFKEYDAGTVSWISNVTITMTLVGGLSASYIISIIGIRKTSILGAALGVIGLLLASFSDKIWQLVLTQGIIYGYGSSLIVNISLLMQALWFEKRRGLAIGIVSSGGAIGALIMVPLVTSTINNLGIKWSFRILALIFLASTALGCIFYKPRLPFKPNRKVIDFKMLKDPFIVLLSLGGFFMQFGYNVPLLFFPASLRSLGYEQTFATNFIMVMAGASVIGRLGSGQLADIIPPLYIVIFGNVVAGIIILTLWYLGNSLSTYTIFYVLFGLFGINFHSLAPSMISSRYSYDKVSQVNGLLFLTLGISVFISIPVIGHIFQKLGKRIVFDHIIVFGGVSYLISSAILVILGIYLKRAPQPK